MFRMFIYRIVKWGGNEVSRNQIKSIYIKDYKNFSGDDIGIELAQPFNIIIGRNNTGKSSLLDVFSYLTNLEEFKKHYSSFGKIFMEYELSENDISSVFQRNTRGGVINGNHYDFGKEFIGETFFVEIALGDKNNTYKGVFTTFNNEQYDSTYKDYWERLSKNLGNKLNSYTFLRLGAERDIVSELEASEMLLTSNGGGATNLVHKFINLSTLNSKLVEEELLKILNEIIYPDAYFTDIVVQQIEDNEQLLWEIFLEEDNKGRVALSNSGSGLKTIILVLINFILMPKILDKNKSEIIFALEELENNLHPALQRNLFKYIREWAVENETTVFLTTHSNIPINLFSGDINTQIIHIQKINKIVRPKKLDGYLDNIRLLDDLDVRASDILQANGVIWVEGPSDRIYLNKWIEIFSEGEIKEGYDYQIVFYGGRLLSHLELQDPSNEDSNLINLLLTNRNAAIIIDSDKRYRSQAINNTKKRIKAQFENVDSLCWITKGKEIENYIPLTTLERFYNVNIEGEFERYHLIDNFLDSIKEGEGKTFLRNKVKFAKEISHQFSKEELESSLDLKDRIEDLIENIRQWNSK
jgi:putative ATP-dependent endonuclease of the OLD family